MKTGLHRYVRKPNLFVQKAISTLATTLTRLESARVLRESGISATPSLSLAESAIINEYVPALRSRNGLVVYDIGANTGQHALALAKLSQVSAVIAFEPAPDAFEILRQNATHIPKLRCLKCALGDTNGTAKLHLNDFTPSSSMLSMLETHVLHFPYTKHSVEIVVPVRRLDDIVRELKLPPPDVIKIDVQGYEDRVFRGGEATITSAEWLNIELGLEPLYADAPNFDEMYRIIVGLGFAIVELASDLRTADGRQLQVNGLFRKRSCIDRNAADPENQHATTPAESDFRHDRLH